MARGLKTMSIDGGKSLMRKVYNRFPDMVEDKSLIGNMWIIEEKGEEYWKSFIAELRQEEPNNLPDENAVDWRSQVVTPISTDKSTDPKERIGQLREDLEYHEKLYYTDPENVEISDYEYDMMMKELEKLEKDYPHFANEESPSVRVGFSGSETQKNFEKSLNKL